MTTIPLLTVEGAPHACGLAHGRRFAREIAENVETYLRRFELSGLRRKAAFAEAERWLAAMADQSPSYVEEMRGIADGSGAGMDNVALLNARYELAFTLFGQEATRGELVAAGPDGCTTFGLTPDVTADGHTWLGQNWDWLEGLHGRTLVLHLHRHDRPSFVCLTEAGIVGGKMGVNECGIGLVENGLASSHDGRNPYQKPFHMRCREILDAETFQAAQLPVNATPRTCSANFVIGAPGGEVVDLEASPDHVRSLYPEDGIVTHSNHFLTEGHGTSLLDKIAPNTLERVGRMRRLLAEQHGRISFDGMRAAASDHVGLPNAICRHPDATQPSARRTMTAAAVLIDLEARTMHVANGPPCENDYVAFAV
jgi:isopenicillin-N N-acyltransferase-like protein